MFAKFLNLRSDSGLPNLFNLYRLASFRVLNVRSDKPQLHAGMCVTVMHAVQEYLMHHNIIYMYGVDRGRFEFARSAAMNGSTQACFCASTSLHLSLTS